MRPELCTRRVFVVSHCRYSATSEQQDFDTGRGAFINRYPVVVVGHNCGLGAVQLVPVLVKGAKLLFHFDALELIIFSDHF